MQLFLTIAGHRAQWTFHDSAPLASWLAAQPWLGDGGLAILQGGGTHASPLLLEALVGAVASADAGARSYTVIPLETSLEREGLPELLAATLGVSCPDQPRAFARSLGVLLQERPLIFTGVFPHEVTAPFLAGAMQLLDFLSKLPTPSSLCLILLAEKSVPSSAPIIFDFRTGAPFEPPLAFAGARRPERWAAYLHHRIAWECGGDADLALRWSSLPLWESIVARVGDDSALESLLNQLAQERYQRLAPDDVSAWRASLGGPGRKLSPTIGSWQPNVGDEPRPAPWLARAFLLDQAAGPLRWRLRHSLTCRPLAAGLLARCLEIESNLMGRYADQLIGETNRATARCRASWQAFTDGAVPAMAYPNYHPAIPNQPDDTWLFGTLGEVLFQLEPEFSRAERASYRDLLALRNAIAHGHYVGWKQYEVLQRMAGHS